MSTGTRKLAIITTCLLAGCAKSPQWYVNRGQALYSKGEYLEALLNYRKAIQKEPRDGAAYLGIARAEFKLANTRTAYQNLLQATELLRDPKSLGEAADLLLEFYIADPRRPQALYDRLTALAGRLPAEGVLSLPGLRIRGHMALTDRQTGKALQYFRQAYSLAPQDHRVLLPLVQAMFAAGQRAEAEQLALQAIGQDKSFGPMYELLYEMYLIDKKPREAEQLALSRIRDNPADPRARFHLARHYHARGDITSMERVVAELASNTKDFPSGRLQAGDFYRAMGTPAAARELYQEGIRLDPARKAAYLKRIAQMLVLERRKGEAAKLLEQVMAEFPNDDELHSMVAALWVDSGASDKIDGAVKEFRRLASRQPSSSEAHFNLARALVARDDPGGAQQELREALRLNAANQDARLLLADLLNREMRYPEAMTLSDAALALEPETPRAELIRAVALMGLARHGEARGILRRLIANQPAYIDAKLQLGLLEISEKNYRQADEIFRQFYEPGQGDLRPLEGLVETRLVQKQFDGAISLLNEELRRNPSVPVRLALASTYMRAGRYDAAVAEFEKVAEALPASPEPQLRIGQAMMLKGDHASAIRRFETAEKLGARDARTLGHLAYAYNLTGNGKAAVEYYRRALALKPDDPALLNNLAYRLAEEGRNLDEALKMIRQALRLEPGNPSMRDTLGLIYLKQGMSDTALKVFTGLAERYPESAAYMHHFGMAQLAAGNRPGARRSLEKALANRPSAAQREQIQRLLATLG
jgi:tetratricopeptide (TPR) repeat protein